MDVNDNLPLPALIREIGRGKNGSRSLSLEQAKALYAAMLAQNVPDLEMGAIMIALRMKGESLTEISGFMQAAQACLLPLTAPSHSAYRTVVIPSYNGARNKANLTPLLAQLLAREGVPVLIHGVVQDPGRVTTAAIMQAMGYRLTQNPEQVLQAMDSRHAAFISIEHLAPAMHRLLKVRARLGLRNSTHTLVKLLQPMIGESLRLTSYTHREYHALLQAYFKTDLGQQNGPVLLMRATEGETVANTARVQEMEYFVQGQSVILQETQMTAMQVGLDVAIDAESTAVWIQQVLQGEKMIPENISLQVGHILRLSKLDNSNGASFL
jgi:anthranilate phosphoribosyltransferase